MRIGLSIVLATVTVGLVAPAAPLLAAPVDCPLSCTVSDGPASVTFNGTFISSADDAAVHGQPGLQSAHGSARPSLTRM